MIHPIMDVKVAVLLTLTLICKCSGQLSARVLFNSRGVNGHITFTEIAGTNNTQITVSLDGLTGGNAWHVHTLPVDQTADPAVQCLSTVVGPHYDPFNTNNNANYSASCRGDPNLCEVGDLSGKFGPIPMNGSLSRTDTTGFLALKGFYSIVGRSVVIHRHDDGSNFECGKIHYLDEDSENVIALQARLISPVAGTIYMRQVSDRDTAIWGKLYWVNDTATTMNHNWHVHELAPGEEYRIGDCSAIGPHYDPTNMGPTNSPGYSTTCTPQTPSGCEVGDLTGKLDTLHVSANPSPFSTNSFFFTDTTINLTVVMNRSIAVHVPNRGAPILACAPLVKSEDIILHSYENGVMDSNLKVSQLSPFEDTVIMSSTSNPVTILGVALNPVTNCRYEESFYAPYPPIDSPEGRPTPDRLVLGAWNQRYNLSSGSVSVFDMPIHSGNNTISGKTVRETSGEDYRVCSALLPQLDGVIMAKASFNDSISGAMYFMQEDFGYGQLGNTHIIVDIYYTAANLSTKGHNWHVHETPTQANTECVAAIGGHYNPFMVSLGNTNDVMNPSQFSNYSDDCSVRYNLRCESGDLSGKHGRLAISSKGPDRPVVSFVDPNLALTGSYSIINRSIGLHDITLGGPLFDCGDIHRVYISNTTVSLRIDADRQLRSQIARTLTEGSSIDPTDVLVLSQTISPLNAGFSCLNVSVRALGFTQEVADQNAQRLSQIAATLSCEGSAVTAEPLSTTLSNNASQPTVNTDPLSTTNGSPVTIESLSVVLLLVCLFLGSDY